MSSNVKIKVSSKSFSKHPILRNELLAAFPYAVFNDKFLDFSEDDFAKFIGGSQGMVVGLERVVDPVLA